ncbi:hypothetical protein [Anaeromyxobacter sp. SG66]|uniref:hypothetical protein n=1 Tax=Anaeromyxobacter sp. SG66 TaxID=2925410 RepID=UPI001F56E8D4|nr:hypothetical protein [Anaeromyxobacter sp. SG66]
MLDHRRKRAEVPIIEIRSRDYWFKVIEMLQQNWALVDDDASGCATIFFFDDGAGVFDRLVLPSMADADRALIRNGFSRFAEDPEAQTFIRAPEPPFRERSHPNGRIYSSGRFWK